MKGGCKGGEREREGGECKLMEKRHEDYYRLISSHDDDRKLEGERGSERGGNGGRGIRGEKERFSCCSGSSIPPFLPLISLYPSVPRGDRGMNDDGGGGKSSVGKLAEQR